jgi:Ser/Thr protein kinase RdoA (MazF antagonist)
VEPANSNFSLENTAVMQWHGAEGSLQQVSDSCKHVYSFIQSGRKRYLRLTSSADRTKEQIEAELDFIAYLRRGGVFAMLPVPSSSGVLVEEFIFPGHTMFVCVFEEAEGERFRYDAAADFNREHFRLRGKTLGLIHALSKTYVPSGEARRFAWDEDKLLLEADRFLPESEKIVRRAYDELREWLRGFPKSKQTFGLIHGDFGETNYRYCNDQLHIFDFDDSCYHWFVYDLAVTIYPHGWRPEGLRLLDWLLEGYSEHMKLDVMLEDITMFCRWRLVYMFLVYARKWGFENLSEQQADWFAQKRENISSGYNWTA